MTALEMVSLGREIPAKFKDYVRAILKCEPCKPPDAGRDDWDELLKALGQHKLIPLFSWRLSSVPAVLRPPADLVTTLHEVFAAGHLRSLQMERQLRVLLGALSGKGVETIVLKGPALAWTVYPNPATRPWLDLDLLVRAPQVETAHSTLTGLGYVCADRRFKPMLKEIYKEDLYTPADAGKADRPVELHWGLFLFPDSDPEETVGGLFSRAIRVCNSGLEFSTLHPIDALIHSAVHSKVAHADGSSLIWTSDAALIAAQLKTMDDWRTLQERIANQTEHDAVQQALSDARRWFGFRPPNGLDDPANWSVPAAASKGRALSYGEHWGGRVARIMRAGSNVSLAARFSFLLRVVFPPVSAMRSSYPPRFAWLLPLSYVRRWLHWLARLR